MKFSILNSKIASVGLASVIAVGVIGVGGVAMAQTSDQTPPAAPSTDSARAHHPVMVGVAALLKDSGVTRDELKQGGTDGLTLAEIINQYGDISADQAKANALATLSTKLDEAVANKRISQEEADKIEAAAPALLDRLLAAVPGQNAGDHPRLHRFGEIAKNALQTVAGVLNIDVATLRQDLKSGQTVADVAGPQQTQAVIDALTANANQAIEKAVADGKLPADKEDAAKEKAATAITRFVNEGRPHRGAGAAPGGSIATPGAAPTN
jgi:hypothetical protein